MVVTSLGLRTSVKMDTSSDISGKKDVSNFSKPFVINGYRPVVRVSGVGRVG